VFVVADKKIDNQRQNEIQQQCFSKNNSMFFYYVLNSFILSFLFIHL